MSLGPTSSSIMQPYGLPCALSTEKEVRSKTARKAAPAALEVNTEGVIQLDGVSTRGVFMSGGPIIETRNMVIVPPGTTTYSPTAAEFVNGYFFFMQNAGTKTIVLPDVLQINNFVNSNLVTSAGPYNPASPVSNPRTMFRVTVCVLGTLQFTFSSKVLPPDYQFNGSGIFGTSVFNPPGDYFQPLEAGIGTSDIVIDPASIGTLRMVYDFWFIQYTTTPKGNSKWLYISTFAN